jgi:predicted protein tyrosine phosphatase
MYNAVGGGVMRRSAAYSVVRHYKALEMRLLFVCGRNRLRSPTAEQMFSRIPGVETCSAGVSPDADQPLTADLVQWADIVFVMEEAQRAKMARRFARALRGKRVVCLSIQDDFEYMTPKLVRLLWERVPRSVPGLAGCRPAEPGAAPDPAGK